MQKPIFTKLLEIQTALKGLAKDKKGNSYDYVSGNKLLGFIRPLMDAKGILLNTEVLSSKFTRQDYIVSGNKPKTEMFCELTMKFTWIDCESGDTLECLWASSGQNGFDKSYGSAVTYGERYFLLKFFHIQTDYDDVDARQDESDPLEDAINYINSLTTVEDLGSAWEYYKEYYGSNQEFKVAFAKKMQEVSSNGTGKK